MSTRSRVVGFSLAIVVPLLVPAMVSAADGPAPSGCDGASVTGFPTNGSARIKSRNPVSFDLSVPAIAAGTYEIDTVTYDTYPERVTESQPSEQLRLQFLDTDGQVIDETGPSVDLADLVVFAEWKGSIGQVVLDRPAVTVRAIHDHIDVEGPANSVSPACFGWTAVESTTTTEPITSAPTTASPTVTSAPTTVPTRVLPEVEEMPDPDPVQGTPRFTG